MKNKTVKKALIAAAILLAASIGFAMVAIFCEGDWRGVGLALCLLTFLPCLGCFVAAAGLSSDKGKKSSSAQSSRTDGKYEKIFPHMTTDDDSTDEEKEVDDFLIMDMMDDDE